MQKKHSRLCVLVIYLLPLLFVGGCDEVKSFIGEMVFGPRDERIDEPHRSPVNQPGFDKRRL